MRVDIDIDLQGWRPQKGQRDKYGELIEDRIYNQKDFDRSLVIDDRTWLVAQTISEYLKRTDPMAKTIVFCNDIDHAERMRRALVNLNPEQIAKNDNYVLKITGDDEIGKAQLDNFINAKKPYPVIATTSELMTTGVDAKTCKLVVLDQHIQSMTKFKQIIGRGTRIDEKHGKLWFTILDFKKATELFADERFDGIPEKVLVTNPKEIEDDPDIFVDNPDAENVIQDDQATAKQGTVDIPAPYNGNGEIPWDDKNSKVHKFHVAGIAVKKLAERVQYYDSDGKLVTESFKDYTRKTLQREFASLDDFVKRWQSAERKQAVLDELAEVGVIWEALSEDVSKDMDPFDLICHVVFDQPPLTRKERANNVKKRDYFTRYSAPAQAVLKALLDKYADTGVTEIESLQTLKTPPFTEMGAPMEIVKSAFGGKPEYEKALTELEAELYGQVS